MPEGPEIRRAADVLSAAISGQRVRKFFFSYLELKPWERKLQGTTVCAVQAHGKAILTRFSNDFTLYTHNQLYGRWQIISGGDYPESTRQLRVAIHTNKQTALLYSASDIRILTEEEVHEHPYLRRLGPDLLDIELVAEQIATRLAEKKHRRRSLMGLLQDQAVLAGMGNYLCCEVLHVTGIHPRQRTANLTTEQINRLAKNCLQLTRQSYETGGITNDTNRAKAMQKEGLTFENYRFHVYRRAGQPCYRCGTPIVKSKFCGRMSYICPVCQSEP